MRSLLGVRKTDGFSLTEIVVAMMVLGILVVAMAPLLSLSYSNIMASGDHAAQLGEGRGQMEAMIAGDVPDRPGSIGMTFTGGTSFTVDGGMIDAIQSLITFLPSIPVIQLSPERVTEGYDRGTTVAVTGSDTNFGNGTTALAYPDNGGSPIPLDVDVINSTSCILTLPVNDGLQNSEGPYLVAITYDNETGVSETAHGVLSVDLPLLMAGGADGTIIVADRGDHWESRDAGVLGAINGIACNGNRFVAVGKEGRVAFLADGVPWMHETIGGGVDLNSVAFVGIRATVIVGDDGTALFSNGGTEWSPVDGLTSSYDLQDVAGTVNNETGAVTFVAVGTNSETVPEDPEDGVIVTLNPTDKTSPHVFTLDDRSVNSVCLGQDLSGNELFVAVGDGGTVLTSSDGLEWTEQAIGSDNLHAVCYASDQPYRYVAVGAGGAIYRSADGGSWESQSLTTVIDLNGVSWTGERFVAVGVGGEIWTSSDGANWTRIVPGSTDNPATKDLYCVGN